MLFDGEFGACGRREAVRMVFAEGVGVLSLECEGYAGAPGSTGVACVFDWLLGELYLIRIEELTDEYALLGG